ncbi:MAG: hypothetical protein RBS88_09400, partial [Spongiibacteraceae bacterium]|nr:hypothetical protein [Spongiibacteraceae bacterium]
MNAPRSSLLKAIPLRQQLLTIALAGILPLAIAAGLGLVSIMRNQALEAEARALEITRLAATAIELELSRSLNVLQALAQSPLLDNDDLTSFEELARRIMASVPGWQAVIVARPDGVPVAHFSYRQTPAPQQPIERASFAEVIRTHQ